MSRSEQPKASERQTRWVSKDAQIIGGPNGNEISIGVGCVIHPFAVIDATGAPIRIGDYCTIDEHACITSPSASQHDGRGGGAVTTMVLGDYNHIGPHCRLESASIGSDNVFHARSSTGVMSTVGNHCILAPTARVTHDAVLPDGTRVLGDGRWVPRGADDADAQEERDAQTKRSRFFRSAQLV